MTAERFIATLRSTDPHHQATFVQATMARDLNRTWTEVLSRLVDDLEGATSDSERLLRRGEVEKVIACLPDDPRKSSNVLRSDATTALQRLLDVAAYPQRFLVIKKHILLSEAQVQPVLSIICRAIERGVELDEPSQEVLLDALQQLVVQDVDSALAMFQTLRETHRRGLSAMDVLGVLEQRLCLVGLDSIWGPSLRSRYVKELVSAGFLVHPDGLLFVGPTGTSKTFMAKLVARNSAFPNVELVNSAASDARQEMLSAFSRAQTEKISILLDEVYSLPLAAQEACLAECGRPNAQFRLMATSSTPFAQLVERLKPDFLARINGWRFDLKGLAETPADLDEVIRRLAKSLKKDIEADVVERLKAFNWPMNHRQVDKAMKELSKLSDGAGSGRIDEALIDKTWHAMSQELKDILTPVATRRQSSR